VKYSHYTTDFELKVTEYAEKHGNRAAGGEFTVSEFIVRYWRMQKDALIQTINESWRAFGRPKSGKFPELEDEILEHVGVCAIIVSVSRTKSCISNHVTEHRGTI
jgi:hypothetical protein